MHFARRNTPQRTAVHLLKASRHGHSPLLISSGILLLALGAFLGMLWGFRIGVREGRSTAELSTREHWVDLLETFDQRHPFPCRASERSDAAVTHLTGRQET